MNSISKFTKWQIINSIGLNLIIVYLLADKYFGFSKEIAISILILIFIGFTIFSVYKYRGQMTKNSSDIIRDYHEILSMFKELETKVKDLDKGQIHIIDKIKSSEAGNISMNEKISKGQKDIIAKTDNILSMIENRFK